MTNFPVKDESQKHLTLELVKPFPLNCHLATTPSLNFGEFHKVAASPSPGIGKMMQPLALSSANLLMVLIRSCLGGTA